MKSRRLRVIVGVCLVVVFFMGVLGCATIKRKVAETVLDNSIEMFFDDAEEDLLRHILEIDCDKMVREGFSGLGLLTQLIGAFVPDAYALSAINSLVYAAGGILVEYEDPEFAMYLYKKSRMYGMAALKKNKKFREGLEKGIKIHKLVHHLDGRYKSALLYTSLGWGMQVMLDPDDMFELINMPDIIAMVDRSIEIDEDFLGGLGLTFKGAYYAFIPEFMGLGGGPESSKATFDKAKAKTDGRALLADTFRARYWATLMKDEEMFDRLLKITIEIPHGHPRDLTLLNELARWKAKEYLRDKDEWF